MDPTNNYSQLLCATKYFKKGPSYLHGAMQPCEHAFTFWSVGIIFSTNCPRCNKSIDFKATLQSVKENEIEQAARPGRQTIFFHTQSKFNQFGSAYEHKFVPYMKDKLNCIVKLIFEKNSAGPSVKVIFTKEVDVQHAFEYYTRDVEYSDEGILNRIDPFEHLGHSGIFATEERAKRISDRIIRVEHFPEGLKSIAKFFEKSAKS